MRGRPETRRQLRGLAALVAAAAAAITLAHGGAAWGSAARVEPSPRGGQALSEERVVLIHGLGRSGRSMWLLQRRLEAEGHATHVVSYPSTERTLAEIANGLDSELAQCCAGERLHFVTHSMGGIVLREWLARNEGASQWVGRVVMLSPPNHGSALVDALGRASRLLGPAGGTLGTGAEGTPSRLNAGGPVDFEVGIIAGDRSRNPLGSWILEGPDDGTVSVASARLAGMRDFLVLPTSHSWLMYDREVARQSLHFLRFGRFSRIDRSGPLAATVPLDAATDMLR